MPTSTEQNTKFQERDDRPGGCGAEHEAPAITELERRLSDCLNTTSIWVAQRAWDQDLVRFQAEFESVVGEIRTTLLGLLAVHHDAPDQLAELRQCISELDTLRDDRSGTAPMPDGLVSDLKRLISLLMQTNVWLNASKGR